MKDARKHFRLITGGRYEVAKSQNLRTGCNIPESGIYQVLHPQHRLPREVTFIKDQPFPRCSKCDEPVCFALVRSAPAVASPNRFQVTLYELPEMVADHDALAG